MDNVFTITPMSQRITLEPGKTYTASITIVNPADATGDFHYKVYTAPYGVVGEDYTADLMTKNEHTKLMDWISISEPSGAVSPNTSKKIEFTIKVPESAGAGGQYAAIMVGADEKNEKSDGVAINNVFEMASLIYGHVTGDIKHEGEILENNVPGFAAVTPVTLTAKISNNGNVHEDATFVIRVSNFFTGDVILPTEDNDGNYTEIIMPESTRSITREVSNLPMLGVVKVSQTIYYNGVSSTEEKNLIICPIWFLLLAFATIAALIAVIVKIIKRHAKKKHAI